MDWSHVYVAVGAYLAAHLPTIGMRIDQWFQAWLKAKYGPQEPPLMAIGKVDGANPFAKPLSSAPPPSA